MAKKKQPSVEPGLDVIYDVVIYVDHLTPFGHLPAEYPREASAAWTFARVAIRAIDDVKKQVSYEGDVDITISLRNLANAVRIQYGLPDLESFMRFMPACRAEAFRLNRHWPGDFQTWLDTGSRIRDEVTRDIKE